MAVELRGDVKYLAVEQPQSWSQARETLRLARFYTFHEFQPQTVPSTFKVPRDLTSDKECSSV